MTQLTPKPEPRPAGTLAPLPRHDPIVALPIVVLYPHSRCNCRCQMCDIWQIRDKVEISPEEVARWIPELRRLQVRRVVLSGGEPLMHSDLWAVCEALRAEGIGITLLSTGLLLRRHAANVVRYCDDVVVSLDGPREVHDLIRNVARAFDKLQDGVRAIKAADQRTTVSGRCTIQRANFRHLRATVRAARAIGLDRISFLAADVSTDAFNRPGGWDTERVQQVALGVDDLPVLESELRALEAEHRPDFDVGYIAETPEKLRQRILRYFQALLGIGDFAPIDCNAPWVSTVIETDGSVRPCFFQPALGNIRQAGSLDAVLNSPAAVAWRQGLDTHRNAICRKCVCSISLRAATEQVSAV